MALNIVTSVQPLNVHNIIALIYGDPGIWKTSLAFTADKPLLFDFDKGAYRAYNRKDSVQIANWYEVAKFSAKELEPYNTIIIDTAGRALDMIADSLKGDSRNTRKDGQLSQQGYGSLAGIFNNWLKMLRSMGKDIVLLAHTAEDKNGEDIIKRPDMVGSSKREVYKIADIMGYMTTQNSRDGSITALNFVPHVSYLAKNSGNIGNVVIAPMIDAPNQMADMIQATKNHINSMSSEAAQAHQDLSNVRTALLSAENAKDFNNLVASLDVTHPLYQQMRREIWECAKPKSHIGFNATSKRFIDVSDDTEIAKELVPEVIEEAIVTDGSDAQLAPVNPDEILTRIKSLENLSQGAVIAFELKEIESKPDLQIGADDLKCLWAELKKAEQPLRAEYANILKSIRSANTKEDLDRLYEVVKDKSSGYPDSGKEHLNNELQLRLEAISA